MVQTGYVKRRKIFNKKIGDWKYYFQQYISKRDGKKVRKILMGTYGFAELPLDVQEKVAAKYIAPLEANLEAKEREHSALDEKNSDLTLEWANTYEASLLDFADEIVQQSIRHDASQISKQLDLIGEKQEQLYFEIKELKAELARYDYRTRKFKAAYIQVKRNMGYTVKSLAVELDISERTVYHYLKKARSRMRVLD